MLLERHRQLGTLASTPVAVAGGKKAVTGAPSYPGKLAPSPDGKMIAISDSNHNRIVVADVQTGKILLKIGGPSRGTQNGSFEQARFFRPQGLAWVGDRIYVADTENHALREINLAAKAVKTLAGDGRQGDWISGAQEGRSTRLSSPWDVAHQEEFLFIAMAGLHQIWAYHTESGKIGPFAGSGHENIIDGTLAEAQFAQPSGLSIYNGFVLVADSEVSAVRLIDLKRKSIHAVVGEGLFEFGHRDGSVAEARLQHPLGVHCAGNKIYVADTYNHAIRLVDLDSQQVSTLVGGKKSLCRLDDPACDTLGLYEPSDVKQLGSMLYIADTNNHLVRTFNLEKMILGTLAVKE